jgi:hypothetical protein
VFDPFLIEGIAPSILVLLPFLVVAITLAIREGFKAAGKEVPALATQIVAFVVSAGAVVGTFVLSGAALPVDFGGWSQLIVSLFSLQMLAYEIVVKRIVALLQK